MQDAIGKAGIKTKHEILLCTECQLQVETQLSLHQCRRLRQETAKTLFPLILTPASQVDVGQFVTTGCELLDKVLGGGIPVHGITEISGKSTCGKTQLCLQLSLTAQWPPECKGLSSGVLYICTEDKFPSRRLEQLMKQFPISGFITKPDYGDNIFVEYTHDVCVATRAPQLMAHRCIRLLVIDSVAGVFRTHLEDGVMNRAKALRNLAKQLYKLAKEHSTAVVCVNQVAEVPREDGECVLEVPTLGLSWANLVHTRLRMSRDQSGQRYLEVLSSKEIASSIKQPYQITAEGLFGS